jgi:hypothetical protein
LVVALVNAYEGKDVTSRTLVHRDDAATPTPRHRRTPAAMAK